MSSDRGTPVHAGESAKGKDPPAALSGDGVHISSDDKKLAAFAPVVTEIAIYFH